MFELVGRDPLIEIALELEQIALNDPYFKERQLYPNVDFYTGIIYKVLQEEIRHSDSQRICSRCFSRVRAYRDG